VTENNVRPCWHHNDVKAAVAVEYVDEVQSWANMYGAKGANADSREFLAGFTLALQESADAYQAGRYLDDFFDWPVAGDLLSILDRCYARMPFMVKGFVQQWVMRTSLRFPAKKGDIVKCRVGAVELGGEVIEVLHSEAVGIVALNGNGKLLNVNAEEVLEIVSTKEDRVVPSNKKGK